MQKPTLVALLLLWSVSIYSQTSLSGIINDYTAVSAYAFCESQLTVENSSSFSEGDEVLIIQMNGATIDQSNNAGFGNITNWGSAGLFEKSTVTSVLGNTIVLDTWLINDYDFGHAVQLVRVPVYENAVVDNSLTAMPWNGTTGGVLVFHVNGLLEIDVPISVSGAGFRGGITETVNDNNCTWLLNQNNYSYSSGNWRGAMKGEGIAAVDTDNIAGRGARANGGGGGNDHNSGGGGGGNYGSGGTGGENQEPSTFGCDGNFPGLGGKGLEPFNGQRLFMGGGGGAGHSNNNVGTNGGNGGGILMITAGDIGGTNGQILANGNGSTVTNGGDGGGGGGAGGTVWIQTENISNELYIETNGHQGSDVNNGGTDRCFGPGGGGAGGVVYCNLLGTSGLLFASANGGDSGITTNSSNACNGSSLNGEAGENGLTTSQIQLPEGEGPVGPTAITEQPINTPFCIGNSGMFSVVATGLDAAYQWEINDGNGFLPLEEIAPFSGTQSNLLLIDNVEAAIVGQELRVVVNSSCGAEVISEIIIINATAEPQANFDFTANDFEVNFNNLSTGQGTYTWTFGTGDSSMEINPSYEYPGEGGYIVSLLLENDCGTSTFQDTVILGEALSPDFSADVATGCVPHGVQFTDETEGFVSSWNWSFPGGDPSSSTQQNPFIVYNEPGVYDVVMAAQNNVNDLSITYANLIQVGDEPIAGFTAADNNLEVTFTNTSQFADTYLWDFGDGSTPTVLENPIHSYNTPGIYEVTLTVENQFCGGNMFTLTIEIGTSPTIQLQKNNWLVFPNPVSEFLTIQSSNFSGDLELQLFDVTGKAVLSRDLFFNGSVLLEMENLETGVYFLELNGGGESAVFKIVK
ncbi:MAG: PKD domain-containing protein [Saprospiraceae bacterium]